jgi:hypothetical protein
VYFPDLEIRKKMRNATINHFSKDKEVWVLHPRSDSVLVSNYGRIKGLLTDKLYSLHKNKQGYYMTNIVFNDGRGRRSYMVSRAVCESFYGFYDEVQQFLEANHINGNKNDNSIYNLEWLTRYENLKHARDNKLFKRNTAALGYFKYSDLDIDTMKNLYNNGISIKNIAKKFNGCRAYISNLIKNKTRRQNDIRS